MKKNYNIILFIIFVLVGGYFVLTRETGIESPVVESSLQVYSNPQIGLEFDFKVGSDGYAAVEMNAEEGEKEFIKTVILMHADDVANLANIPEGSEGSPVMAVLVFKNIKKLSSRAWALANPNFSNINAKQGEVADALVGGAEAVRYMSDGLYASEIFVVANGENVYVFTGMFIDEESALRRDFPPLVESVRFIPVTTIQPEVKP